MSHAPSSRPEITWSILHPARPTAAYMRTVVAAAAAYRVDSFEACGDAHSSLGGLEGCIRFRDYPEAARHLRTADIAENTRELREVARLAHESGRPFYWWHREVMVPRAIVESVPGLLDENGEFNLRGEAYHALLRAKLREFFENVPEVDGIVLTVTESDFSVIHNSDPERYPPALVVRDVVTTFATELQRMNKRFILRSFGSIAQDYRDIIAGARQVAPGLTFEIETKITPYDFSPFLEFNPFLEAAPPHGLGAEYDSIGEFLGAGYLPAADPARVIESVRYAQLRHATRHVIRVDRIGHATFDSTQAINLLAFDRALHDPAVTAGDIWREWAQARWAACPAEMTAVMQAGIGMVKKTHFIDGHVIFHAFPLHAELRWIKACGILSVFQPRTSLSRHRGMWGILTDKTTPDRAALLREKDEAVQIAGESLAALRLLETCLTASEFRLAETAWANAVVVTGLIRHGCRALCAYFEDMEQVRADHPALTRALEAAKPDFEQCLGVTLQLAPGEAAAARADAQHEYGEPAQWRDCIKDTYARPLWRILQLLDGEFQAEWAERAAWQATPGLVDFVLCGSITHDYRVHRYMHASHAALHDGRPARIVGNRVFPNGFIECVLAVPANRPARLIIRGEPAKSAGFRLILDDHAEDVRYDENGFHGRDLPAGPGGTLTVRLQKFGAAYPWIYAIAILAR